MHDENEVTIVLGDERVIVALDGVRAEVTGVDVVRGVKRVVARQLLQAINSVPDIREQERRQQEYEAQSQLRGYNEAPGHELRQAIASSNRGLFRR